VHSVKCIDNLLSAVTILDDDPSALGEPLPKAGGARCYYGGALSKSLLSNPCHPFLAAEEDENVNLNEEGVHGCGLQLAGLRPPRRQGPLARTWCALAAQHEAGNPGRMSGERARKTVNPLAPTDLTSK
jgi:hypothetical protein